VLEIVDREKPEGVIVQFGGQTPLKLARDLEAAGVPIIGTTPDSIDMAEDRERFQQMLHELKLLQPPTGPRARPRRRSWRPRDRLPRWWCGPPTCWAGAPWRSCTRIRPRALHEGAVKVSNDSPVLIDRFLNDAIEVDVDAVCDGTQVIIGGIMEHVEQAGVHSGDSACSLPPFSLSAALQDELRSQTVAMAMGLKVIGLMNVQFAIQDDKVFVLEVNPAPRERCPTSPRPSARRSRRWPRAAWPASRCLPGRDEGSGGPVLLGQGGGVPFIKFPGVTRSWGRR